MGKGSDRQGGTSGQGGGDTDAGASRLGERFTVAVLLGMVLVLGYVRFILLPGQESPEPLTFAFENPMLDAAPGERVIFRGHDNPGLEQCSVVRPEGVVLRPHKGVDRIGQNRGLRSALPYLAVSLRPIAPGGKGCGGPETEQDVVLYSLNNFGMPADTNVRVLSMRPSWMRWNEQELAVYEVVFERYGPLSGRWTTFLAREAPVAGLVKMTRIPSDEKTRYVEVHYRELLE